MVSPYLDRDPIDPPPRPFEVVDDNGYIFVRRRDGKHYRPFEPMGINPEGYLGRCEWLCDLLNDAPDYGAMAQIRRARAVDRPRRTSELDIALEQFAEDVAEIKRITQQAAE